MLARLACLARGAARVAAYVQLLLLLLCCCMLWCACSPYRMLRRWDTGLNKKRLAYFFFARDDTEYKLMPGDELKLRHRAPGNRGPWEGVGHVTLVSRGAGLTWCGSAAHELILT